MSIFNEQELKLLSAALGSHSAHLRKLKHEHKDDRDYLIKELDQCADLHAKIKENL